MVGKPRGEVRKVQISITLDSHLADYMAHEENRSSVIEELIQKHYENLDHQEKIKIIKCSNCKQEQVVPNEFDIKTEWHCPHCRNRFFSLFDRWISVFKNKEEGV